MSDNIQVVVRCRARNDREVQARSPSIIELPDPVYARDLPYINVNVCPEGSSTNSLSAQYLTVPKPQKRFKVDQVYGPGADQALLFESVAQPLFTDFIQGANVTILAYGQTGLGKTHTMCGDMTGDGAGIIPRVLSRLFTSINSDYSVKMSCLELYNEELRDLMDDDLGLSSTRAKLRLVPDSGRGDTSVPKVQNLCELSLDNAEMALKVVDRCLGKRRVGATKLNDQSSRSHSILSLILYREIPAVAGAPQFRISRMNLVDLAGSEDINKSGAVNERAREAGLINQSLLALGKVINCLSEGKDPKHVPYRESKLTRLLQGLLGGKTKTALIATVSPAKLNASETLSTLNYASKAKNIRNLPQSIQDSETILKKVLVGELASQISRLTRDMLASKDKEESVKISRQNYLEYTSNVAHLQTHLEEKDTRLLTLEAAIESKNSEIENLHIKIAAAEKKITGALTEMASRDQEILQLNERVFQLQEKYLQQNQKVADIMESNITGVNEVLKKTVTTISEDKLRLSKTLEGSKRKLIDDLISSQSKLAQGIEDLHKLLELRSYVEAVFAENMDSAAILLEVSSFAVDHETRNMANNQAKLRHSVAQTLLADVHQPLVQLLVRQSHEEAALAKQRLIAELTCTVDTIFGFHQGKFEQALTLVATNVLGNAEKLVVERFDGFEQKNMEMLQNIDTKTGGLKRRVKSLSEEFAARKSVACDQIISSVEQLLNQGVTFLTGTALLETDGAEKGILMSFERISRQLSQSGLVLEKNISAVSQDLSKFVGCVSSLSPSSPEKTLLVPRLVNTLCSPKTKKRKFSPVRREMTQTRIPQLSPVYKR